MPDYVAQDVTQSVTPDRRVQEGCVQVYRVVVTTPILADTQHPSAPQVTDNSPHSAPREAHGVRDVLDSALRVGSNVEEQSPVTGRKKPLVAWGGHSRYHNSGSHMAVTKYYYCFSSLERG